VPAKLKLKKTKSGVKTANAMLANVKPLARQQAESVLSKRHNNPLLQQVDKLGQRELGAR
jgi:hypothetical protein